MRTWRDKAKEMIGEGCLAAYREANTRKNGKKYKKHRPYTVPEWCERLIDALGEDDEHEAKRIMMLVRENALSLV